MTLSTPRVPRLATALFVLAAGINLAGCHLEIDNKAEARSEWKKSFTLPKGGTFEIRNTNGLIEVSPGEGDQISVTAERIAKAATEAEAKDQAEKMEIRETTSGDTIILDSKFSVSGMFGNSKQVKYYVRAPRGTTLRLTNTNGEIQINDMTGELRIETTNGSVKAIGISGPTHASTTNGAVSLDFASIPAEGVSAETTNGGVTITVPKDAKARINARVSNGGIEADGLSLGITEQSRRRLDATINGGGPDIRLETTNGGIRVRGK
jgi:DUF4097 and DUF4098 domain-containing protein YvlB